MKVICLYLHLCRFCFFLFLSIYLRILLNRCALSTEHAYSWTDRDHRVSAFLPLLCAFFFVSVQWVCTTLFWSVRHHAMCVIVVTSNGNWICMLASFSWKWITCFIIVFVEVHFVFVYLVLLYLYYIFCFYFFFSFLSFSLSFTIQNAFRSTQARRTQPDTIHRAEIFSPEKLKWERKEMQHIDSQII